VFDAKRESAEALIENGAVRAASPAELAKRVTVVVSCLPTPREVESVALGPCGLFSSATPRAIHIECSTVGPACVRRLADGARRAGIRLVDAPVSRGAEREGEGGEAEIVLWAGAAADHFDLARPVLDLLADRVVYCGGVGLGQTTKIVNNLIAHALIVLVGEALALGLRAGASLDVLSTSLQHGTGQNRVLDELFPHSLFRGEFRPGLRLEHALKDIDLARELARERDLELVSLAPAQGLFEEARARGWGDLSAHSAVRLIEERFGVRLRSLLAPDREESSG